MISAQWRVDSACLWGQPVQSLFAHLGVSLRFCWVLEHSHRKDDSSLGCIHKGSVPSSSIIWNRCGAACLRRKKQKEQKFKVIFSLHWVWGHPSLHETLSQATNHKWTYKRHPLFCLLTVIKDTVLTAAKKILPVYTPRLEDIEETQENTMFGVWKN